MKLSPLVLAIRAVSAEFAQRMYIPVILIIGGVALVVLSLLIWLTTVSAWWWLLLAPVVLAIIAGIVLALVAWFAINLVRPKQTKLQRRTVKSFVDGLQKTSEVIQTPKFIILFRLVKDLLIPGKQSFVTEISTTASSLKTDLQTVVRSFQDGAIAPQQNDDRSIH